MTERSLQYGKVLYSLHIKEEEIADMCDILTENKELVQALDNPSIKLDEKHKVIDKLFAPSVRGFLKVVIDNQMMGQMKDILEAYEDCVIEDKNWVKAEFFYVTKPEEKQIEQVKARICAEYHKDGVELKLVEKPSLIGGFVLKVYDFETDRSVAGTLEQLKRNLIRR